MSLSKADIIARLQREILPLQGYKPAAAGQPFDAGLGVVVDAFPNASFPLGAIHEFICTGAEDASATSAFIAGIVSAIMKQAGTSLWISSSQTIFPPALQLFGIDPCKIIFVDIVREKERIWAIEEALKCPAIAAVIGDIQEISFTASRRFQLAVEQSHVTGFVLRRNPKNMATACMARWQVASLPSACADQLPGVGAPRWHVQLQKVRNGKPGKWSLEWNAGGFQHIYKQASIDVEQRKVG